MKRIDIFIVSICILSSFFLVPLLKPGLPQTHDGESHVARIFAYHQGLKDLQIPVRWAGNLNYSYGSPLFIFFYSLPYFTGSFLYILGISLENAFKLIIGLSFIVAPVCFFLWSRYFFKKNVALIASIFYGLAPYHLLDLYVRGDIGEVVSFVFLPLVFLYIEKYVELKRLKYIFLGGIFFTFLIISHQGLALMFSPVIIGYIMLKTYPSINRAKTCFMLVVGLLLSCFFWLPFILESRFIISDALFGEMYKSHFPKLTQLLHSPWGFGPNVNEVGGLSPQIGLIPVLSVFATALLLYKFKKNINIVLFWLIVFIGSVFLSLSMSSFIYEHFEMLRRLQFPWRFIALSSFASAVLSGYFISAVSKKMGIIVIAIFVISIIPLVKVKGYINFQDSYYRNYLGTTFHHGEATTIWTDGDPSRFPKGKIEIIDGNGKIESFSKKSHIHKLKINAKTNVRILDNTLYFPGWQVIVDGKKIPIEFQDMNHRGLITFSVPKGMHNIEVVFKESPVRLFSNMVSLFSIVGISSMVVIRRFIPLVKKR